MTRLRSGLYLVLASLLLAGCGRQGTLQPPGEYPPDDQLTEEVLNTEKDDTP